MLHFKHILILGLLLITTSSWSFIGTRGGGKGVVCRDKNNNIKTVELLDLWEARARGVQFPDYSGDKKVLLTQALRRIQPFLQNYGIELVSQYTYDHFFSNYAFSLLNCSDPNQSCPVTDGYASYKRVYQDLPLTQDSLEGDLTLPPNCKIEQLLIYYKMRGSEENEVPVPIEISGADYVMNMNLIKYMDNLSVIGLFAHEAIYRLLDSWNGEANSLRIRRTVSHAMAGNSFETKSHYLASLNAPYVSCGYMDNGYWQRLLFVQDPKSSTPKVIAMADTINYVTLINFHNGQLSSTDLDTNVPIDVFAKSLSENKNFNIKITGAPDDIEFATTINFQMGSEGKISVVGRTGGGTVGHGVDTRVQCIFIPKVMPANN